MPLGIRSQITKFLVMLPHQQRAHAVIVYSYNTYLHIFSCIDSNVFAESETLKSVQCFSSSFLALTACDLPLSE